MAVEAVVRDVQFSAAKPFRVRQVPFEDFLGCLEPMEQLRLLAPEFFGAVRGLLIHLLIFFERFDASLLAEILGRRNGLFFQNVRIEFLHGSSGGRARAESLPRPSQEFRGGRSPIPTLLKSGGLVKNWECRKEVLAQTGWEPHGTGNLGSPVRFGNFLDWAGEYVT